MAKLHVKKGDTVVIISGKDKGKKGKVLTAFPKEGKIIVEGVNMVTKHTRPSQKVPQGGIIHQEAPFYSSKAMIFCPRCEAPVRIGHKFLEDNTKVRVCKRCGEVLDK